MVLSNGTVTVDGFEPGAFRVATDEKNVSRLTFQDVTTVQRFDRVGPGVTSPICRVPLSTSASTLLGEGFP